MITKSKLLELGFRIEDYDDGEKAWSFDITCISDFYISTDMFEGLSPDKFDHINIDAHDTKYGKITDESVLTELINHLNSSII